MSFMAEEKKKRKNELLFREEAREGTWAPSRREKKRREASFALRKEGQKKEGTEGPVS